MSDPTHPPIGRRHLYVVSATDGKARKSSRPEFVYRESHYRHRYRKLLRHGDCMIRYRRERWHTLDFDADDEPLLQRRDVFGWFSVGGRRAGAALLSGIQAPWVGDVDEVARLADDYEWEFGKLWQAIGSGWDDPFDQFLCFGELVWLRDVWVLQQFAAAHDWAGALNALIDETFPQHSTVFARAFPAEYVGRDRELPEGRAFYRNVTALMKHARRKLELKPIPGSAGEDGWMWRPAERVAAHVDLPLFSGGYV